MPGAKEIFMEEQERIAAELEDQGIDAAHAYDMAAERAYGAMRNRFADMADMARMRQKEGQ